MQPERVMNERAQEIITKARAIGVKFVLADEGDVFIIDWRDSSRPDGSAKGEKEALEHYDAILDLLRREKEQEKEQTYGGRRRDLF